jgi:hypothetical protein
MVMAMEEKDRKAMIEYVTAYVRDAWCLEISLYNTHVTVDNAEDEFNRIVEIFEKTKEKEESPWVKVDVFCWTRGVSE